MKNNFIVIEGIDGSGKTTVQNYLVSLYEKHGIPVTPTRAIGGGAIGKVLRSKFMNKRLSGKAELLGAITSLYETYEEVVLPNIVVNDVIVDRYIATTFAYQGFGRGYVDIVKQIADFLFNQEQTVNDVDPNIVIYLKVSSGVSDERINRRPDPQTYLDKERKEFKENVIHGYNETITHLQQYVPNVFVIDANRSIELVLEEIENIFNTIILPYKETI